LFVSPATRVEAKLSKTTKRPSEVIEGSFERSFACARQGVSVASQLAVPAQSNAVRIYGFDDSHVGVLQNPEVSKLLNDLLARSF
jgi:hypothetical protein